MAGLPARVTVFSTDFPYPPNRGGRADVWRRLQALARLGVQIQLVCFFDDVAGKRPSEQERVQVLGVVDRLHAYPNRKGWKPTVQRLLRMHRLPWHAACRTLEGPDLASLHDEVRTFDPTWVWCEGPWCSVNAEDVARRLGKPLVYRSHNIEHLYMRRQAAAAGRLRDRLAWTVACIGLRRFETRMLGRADWVFDISGDDMAFWQARGVRCISWLPPLAEAALATAMPASAPERVGDVVFLGNLTTPNNIRGVEWLLREIVPLVRRQQPDTSVVIAGSNPGDHVRALCRAAGVTLLANPADALAVYRGARVLVNPVRTGSGTHLKAIEMLMTGAPIVSSLQGTCGLPADVKRLFRVADTATEFAAQILDALAVPGDAAPERREAVQLFGVGGLAQALKAMAAPAFER